MSTATTHAGSRTTCQVYRGSLVVPCPNPATVVSHRHRQPVCKAHR